MKLRSDLKKFCSYMSGISRSAYLVIKWSLILSCISAAAALAVRLYIGDFSIRTVRLFLLSEELLTLPQSILLLGAILSVCVEELSTGGRR